MNKLTSMLIVACALAAWCVAARAATANWTGQEFVMSVTGKMLTKCYYNLYGKRYSILIPYGESCPMTIELE